MENEFHHLNQNLTSDLSNYVCLSEFRKPLFKLIIKSLDLPKGSKGLDAGCGIGFYTKILAKFIGSYGTVIGIDLSKGFINYANKNQKPNTQFEEGDINSLQYKDNLFDWIWSADTVWPGPKELGCPNEDPYSIIKDFFTDNLIKRKSFSEQSINSKMGWYLIIGTLPVAVIGLGFKDVIEGVFTKNLYVIAGSLIILAIILAFAEKVGKFDRRLRDLKWYDLFLGFDRETAARFSFLLSIPAVAASGLLEFYQSLKYIDFNGTVNLISATIVSAVVGYISIEFLLRYLRKKSTMVFVYYRIVVGLIILFLIMQGIILP